MAFIYVMTITADLIKIGFAIDPAKRLRQLRKETGKPLAIYAAFDCGKQDHRAVERMVHVALKDRCIYREVFSMAPADALLYIAAAFGTTTRGLERRRWVCTAPEPETAEPEIDARICRGARAGNGWTIPQLAELAGISRNAVAAFERGQKRTRNSTVLAIQRALATGKVVWYRNGPLIGLRVDDEPGGPPLLP